MNSLISKWVQEHKTPRKNQYSSQETLAIEKAIEKFDKSGEIDEILLKGFDQWGRWRGIQAKSALGSWTFMVPKQLQEKELEPHQIFSQRASKNGDGHLRYELKTSFYSEPLPRKPVSTQPLFKASAEKDNVLKPTNPTNPTKGDKNSVNAGTNPRLAKKPQETSVPPLRSYSKIYGNIVFGGPLSHATKGGNPPPPHLPPPTPETLILDNLEEVGGEMRFYTDNPQKLHTPKLQKVGGHCILRIKSWEGTDIKVIAGSLDLEKCKTLDLPKLESLWGDLKAKNATRVNLPRLKEIKGNPKFHPQCQTITIKKILRQMTQDCLSYQAQKTKNSPEPKRLIGEFESLAQEEWKKRQVTKALTSKDLELTL